MLKPPFASSDHAENAWTVQIQPGRRAAWPKVRQAHNPALDGNQWYTNREFMKGVRS